MSYITDESKRGDRKKCSCYKREMQGILRVMELSVFWLTVDKKYSGQFSHSVVSGLYDPWNSACQVSLSITNSRRLLDLMSTESVMPSNHLIFYHHLLLLTSIFPSIRNFSNEPVLHIRQPNCKEFQLQNQSFQWIFTTDFLYYWLVGLLAAQGIIKSLLQHHSSKASILLYSAFFIVQVSHLYMTTGKNHSFD